MAVCRVTMIYICPEAGGQMQEVQEVRAIAGAGLEGDRYEKGKGSWNDIEKTGKGVGHRQVSIMSTDDFVDANKNTVHTFLPRDTRRNIFTTAVDLTSLIAGNAQKEFSIGAVRMKAVKYCEPCKRPDELSGKKGFKKAFELCAGILVEVLTSGTIRVGDEVILHEWSH